MKRMEERIRKIFQKELGAEVLRVADRSHGVEQAVFMVTTAGGEYIAKFPHPGNRAMLGREAFACQTLAGRLPAPQLVCWGRDFLIESCLSGRTLDRVRLAPADRARVYAEWGKAVRRLHAIPMQGYGELQTDRRGAFPTWEKHLGHLLRRDLGALERTGLLKKEELAVVRRYLAAARGIAVEPVRLLHFDLLDSNVLVHEKRFAGLIDYGDLSAGPRAYDLGKLYIEKAGSPDWENFLAGYGKVDMRSVEYFAAVHLLYEIPYYREHQPHRARKLAARLRHLGLGDG